MLLTNLLRSHSQTEANGNTGFNPIGKKGRIIWYTDDSMTNKAIGVGVYGCSTRKKLSFSLEKYTIVFQAEMHAIKACVVGNLDVGYRNREIYTVRKSSCN
jgi:hypothetical protein